MRSLLVARRAPTRRAATDRIPSPGESGLGGTSMSTAQTLRHSAVFASMDLLGRVLASFPVDQLRRKSDGAVEQLAPGPALIAPDEFPLHEWTYSAVASMCLGGNIYAYPYAFDSSMRPAAVKLLDPSRVRPVRDKGRLKYQVWGLEGALTLDRSELYHRRRWVLPGEDAGVTPIRYAAQTIYAGLLAEKFGLDFFANDAVPMGLLSNSAPVDPLKAPGIKDRFKKAVSSRDIAVLGAGWKYETVSVSPNESKFLEVVAATTAQIATWFGLDPRDIGAAVQGSGTIQYQNVEQAGLGFLQFRAQIWIQIFQSLYSEWSPRGQYARLRPDVMLRVDARARAEILDRQLRNGTRNADEARAYDDLAPLPDGQGQAYVYPPQPVYPPTTPPPDAAPRSDKENPHG